MAAPAYKKQASLLLSVIPEITKESCFALHGGTAINLFVRDMTRLSVDIDLTYILFEDRATSLSNIEAGLNRVKENIERAILQVRIIHRKEAGKLLISAQGVSIKVKVSLVGYEILSQSISMALCTIAQK